jgi:hypothetical protein
VASAEKPRQILTRQSDLATVIERQYRNGTV